MRIKNQSVIIPQERILNQIFYMRPDQGTMCWVEGAIEFGCTTGRWQNNRI